VVDGGSTDGTVAWLQRQPVLSWISEKDQGMYDALNKGWQRARGRVLAHLNGDEQYLPGALRSVMRGLEEHPEADIVFGDMLVVRADGSLAAYRKSYPLRWPYVLASHLYVPTCATFWRRRVADQGFRFDPSARARGDADFAVRVLRSGARAVHLPQYLAAFALTGRNLGDSPAAAEERARARREAPPCVRYGRPVLNAARWIEKLAHGAYFQRMPLTYHICRSSEAPAEPPVRQPFVATRATFRWPAR
jgi:glycosyltransferase involved in cell wall biosynthesis